LNVHYYFFCKNTKIKNPYKIFQPVRSFIALPLTTEAKTRAGLRGTFLSSDRKVGAGQSVWHPAETRMGRSLC